ncbi:MAG: delta-60 repeat domain-containing protein [Ahniella sp.]|nr:delta-60 repeat domain-containing protein [Ahniella sp.]
MSINTKCSVKTPPETRSASVCQPIRPVMARIVMLFVCAFGALNATSQDLPVTVLPSPNVDLTQAGVVRSVLRQPDGNWLVAGNYQRLGTVRRPGLGRLAADGSVDTSFQPVTSLSPANIRQIVSRDDGSSLVLHINLVQRLLSNGTVDPTFSSLQFNPTFANSIVVVSDGFIVGGNFTQVLTSPATTVQRLAKFGFDGSLISTFSVGVNSNIRVMQATGPDEIIVGGIFTQAGGQARTGLARISTSGAGALVADWNPVLTRSGGSVSIEDIAVVGNEVFITGLFDTVNGATRTRAAKLGLTTGVVDPVWNVAVTGAQTASLRVVPHNTSVILSTGQPQTYANPPAAGISRRAARIDRTSGVIDTGFDPAMFSENVPSFTATDGDSPTRLLIAGNFVQVDAVQRFGLAQLDAAGRLDLQSGHVEAINPEPCRVWCSIL